MFGIATTSIFNEKWSDIHSFVLISFSRDVLSGFSPPLCCTKAMKWAGHRLIATKRNCQNGIKSGKRAAC